MPPIGPGVPKPYDDDEDETDDESVPQLPTEQCPYCRRPIPVLSDGRRVRHWVMFPDEVCSGSEQ